LDDREPTGVQSEARANTRMVVEAAIDFSNGANREMWNAYRWRLSDNISPWRLGGFTVEDRAPSEFMTGSTGSRPAKRLPSTEQVDSEEQD
jgi:hypothetical protein